MIYKTPIGLIEIIEENGKITKLHFINQDELKEDTQFAKDEESILTKQAYKQIIEYLNGTRKQFTIPIQPKGTVFQIKVWKELQKIPYGQTKIYQDIANAIGNPKACRAVGMANHNNPIAIIIPCHRVIGKNNKLVGYAGGLDIKEKLLKIENEIISNENTIK